MISLGDEVVCILQELTTNCSLCLVTVTMTCIVDCCHSGTIYDLPFVFKGDGSQQQMEFDEDFHFPHTQVVRDVREGKIEWHWVIYLLAAIPAMIAVVIPVILLLLPVGTAVASEK